MAIERENAHDRRAVDERHDQSRADPDLDGADHQRNPFLVGLRRLEIRDMEKGPILRVATNEIRRGHGFEVGAPRAAAEHVDHPGRSVLNEPQGPVVGVAEPRALFDDRVEHRPKVAGRGVDDLEHLRDRRLLLPRLGELAVALSKRREKRVAGQPRRLGFGGARRGCRRRRGASGRHQAGFHLQSGKRSIASI